MSSAFLQYGAGGHGKVVLDALRSLGWRPTHLADDNPALTDFEGLPVLHPGPNLEGLPAEFDYIVAVGDNTARARLYARLSGVGGRPRPVIHSSAILAPNARIGPGTLVCAGVVVNPDAEIGADAILNTACSVDHDCRVGQHTHLCPGVRLGGQVTVGSGVMIGLGAVVLPGITIGDDTIVGAGSVVTRDLPPRVVAYGSPARGRRGVGGR